MTSIIKANENDCRLLSVLATTTFIESHGHSAKPEDITAYVAEKYSEQILKEELGDQQNIYHILYYKDRAAGYSKIMLDTPYPGSDTGNLTKLERLYLLKNFYSLRLGSELLRFTIELSKRSQQRGMWLFVWKENHRAVNFYQKQGFHIIGSHDFKISTTHSNPNHQMFLKFK